MPHLESKTKRGGIDDNIDNLRSNQIAPHSPTRLIGDPAYPSSALGILFTTTKTIKFNNYCAQNNTLRAQGI